MENYNSLQLSNDSVAHNCAEEVQDSKQETPTNFIVSTLEDENDGDFSQEDLSLREASITSIFPRSNKPSLMTVSKHNLRFRR